MSLPPLLDLRGTAIELLDMPPDWPRGDDWIDADILASRLPDAAEQIGILLYHLLEQASDDKNTSDWLLEGRAWASTGDWLRALVAYEYALDGATDKQAPDIWYLRGLALMRQWQFDAAVESFDFARQNRKIIGKVFYASGVSLLALARPQDALRAFDRVIAADSDNVAAITGRAAALAELSRFDDALQAMESILRLGSDHPARVLNNRGNALVRLRRIEPAFASYRRAIEIDPNLIEPKVNSGNVFMLAGQPQQALTSFQEALHDHEPLPGLHANVAAALTELERYDEAIAACDRAIALEPGHARALSTKGRALLAVGRAEDALVALQDALLRRPDYIEALVYRGLVLNQLDRLDDALGTFNLALQLAERHPDAHHGRGIVLYRKDLLGDALSEFERAVAIEPRHADAENSRGNAYMELQDYAAALESYNRVLTLRPDDPDALNNRGNALAQMRRTMEAIDSFDTALRVDPNHADALYNRGVAFADVGMLTQALDSLNASVQARPDDSAEALFWYARVLGRQGRAELALNALRAAVASNEEVRSWIWGQDDFNSLENDALWGRHYQALLRGREARSGTTGNGQQDNGTNANAK